MKKLRKRSQENSKKEFQRNLKRKYLQILKKELKEQENPQQIQVKK